MMPLLPFVQGTSRMSMVQLALKRPYTFIVMAMLIVLATPFAFLEHFAIPIYWNPRRTVVWMGVSPEDFLFAFTIGGISWLLATFLWRDRLASIAGRRGVG